MHAAQTESCTTIFACLQSLSRRFIRCWDVRRSKRASLRVCTDTGDQFGTRCPFFPSFFKQPHPFLWLTHTHTHTHTHKETVAMPASTHTPTHDYRSAALCLPLIQTDNTKRSAKKQSVRKECLSDLLWAGAVKKIDRQCFIETEWIYCR